MRNSTHPTRSPVCTAFLAALLLAVLGGCSSDAPGPVEPDAAAITLLQSGSVIGAGNRDDGGSTQTQSQPSDSTAAGPS